MRLVVMDYETMINCFVAVFYDLKEKKLKVFSVSEFNDDTDLFLDYLKECRDNNYYHVSFNGLAFDGQISQYLLDNYNMLYGSDNPQAFINYVYRYAQHTIDKTRIGERVDYPEYKLQIKQVDLFKLNHWDNAAKKSSLKSIQCAIDWHNVMDMPLPFDNQ